MKKVIIVAPHFPPSNLAAVHRTRLFAMHLPSFGWEPIVVTVHEKYYEEQLDPNLVKLLPQSLRIEKTGAIPLKPIKIIGDIGVRGFLPMLFKIVSIAQKEKPDFLYIPIPSNYAALLGRIVRLITGIPYGIDYIDPWVHSWPGTEKKFSRHWWSMKLGQWLEPWAVKYASLISGVAPGYYEDVLKRNPHLHNRCITAAMPYGGEATDHLKIRELELQHYLFSKEPGKFDFIYAGAMLPRAFAPLEAIFKNIASHKETFSPLRFHFIGSGKSPNDPGGFNTKTLAEKYGLWQSQVFEYPARIPYLDVLVHLEQADAVFILGSTEPHYTPSKTYQGVLSGKPICAVLHNQSTAVAVIEQTGAGKTLAFDGEAGVDDIEKSFNQFIEDFIHFSRNFDRSKVDLQQFEKFSAYRVTEMLAAELEEAIKR